MKHFRHAVRGVMLVIGLIAASVCQADIIVNFVRTTTVPGTFRYDYTLVNTFTTPGYNAYDLFLNFNTSANILSVNQPTGWIDLVSLGSFPVSTTYYDWTSTDFQYDVLPGGSKTFTLTSPRSDLSAIGYQVTVANPLALASPLLLSGTVTPPPQATVPEPGSVALALVLALSGAELLRRRRRMALLPPL